jgi:hypothetical protein
MKRLCTLFLGAMLALGMCAAQAQANLINSALKAGDNLFQDNNAENLIKGAGNTMPGVIQVGDTLQAVLGFASVNGGPTGLNKTNYPGLTANYQLTAIAEIKVLSKTQVGTTVINGVTVPIFNFTFGSGFADGVTSIQLFENSATTSSTVFKRSGTGLTVADSIARATSGTLLTTIGFAASAGGPGGTTFWEATNSPDTLSVFKSVDTQIAGAGFDFAQNVITNPGGLSIGTLGESATSLIPGLGSGQYDIVGSGQLFGIKGQITPFSTYTATRVNFASTLVSGPEPASFLLFGVGFTVLAGLGLRKKRKAEAAA